MILFWLVLGCLSENERPPTRNETANNQPQPSTAMPTAMNDEFAGQQHPPIPPDNPIWEWDAGGFVPDFGWYGEHNWDDVRMRAISHLSTAWRDLARISAAKEQWGEAKAHYQELANELTKVEFKQSQDAAKLHQLLVNAAQRDSRWLSALAAGNLSAATNEAGTIAPLRGRYYQLVVASQAGEDVSQAATALQKELLQHNTLRADLVIDQFDDFKDRHRLRVRLTEAYLDSLDPLDINERWGYWRPIEILRQVTAIGIALEGLGAPTWTLTPQLTRSSDAVPTGILAPSMVLKSLRDQHLELSDTPEEFGRLPTGDSLIDVAGQPGPMGIGSLLKYDVSDTEHRKWLQQEADAIVALIKEEPTKVPARCRKSIGHLKRYSHGSIFYNIKQLRNACTRQLARSGELAAALEIFADSFPLLHQDWACPNRQALLEAIQGRLEAILAPEKGSARLQSSIKNSLDFIQSTRLAEQGRITGPRPPAGPKGHPHNPQQRHQGGVSGPAPGAPPQR